VQKGIRNVYRNSDVGRRLAGEKPLSGSSSEREVVGECVIEWISRKNARRKKS